MFRPALTLARVMGLTLDEVRELVETGYVQEFQDRGLSWEGIARKMGKSRRTVGTLVRRAAGSETPLSGSQRLSAQRKLIERLSRAAMTRTELLSGLASQVGEVALDQLVEEGLVHLDETGTLSVQAGVLDRVGTDARSSTRLAPALP